ncbi:hypothetical protein [Neptunomonas sp.]|uniref:hypothetical protein n=1 Tax=Neptunomonas sp. TaxID=1971898 RepID=UPI003569BDA0
MKPKNTATPEQFAQRLEQGMNQLETLRIYGETCLHSTVSDLANKHGSGLIRQDEPHTHQHGGKTHFRRFWLKPEQLDRALKHIKLHEKAPTATNETGLSNHSKNNDPSKSKPKQPLIKPEHEYSQV